MLKAQILYICARYSTVLHNDNFWIKISFSGLKLNLIWRGLYTAQHIPLCMHRELFWTYLRYWHSHDHTHLFTVALTGIILGFIGWVDHRLSKAVAGSHSKWITQVRNWLAKGFKDACVLHFCLFSLVLSTQGQSNCFSKVSLIS